MFAEIEKLIFKLRKEVYGDLEKGKEIKPKVYFFIQGKDGLSEIIVPGAENFFLNSHMKNYLADYVQFKWTEYKSKGNYRLVAVMILSDQYMVTRNMDGLTEAQQKEIHLKTVPSREKDREECVGFMVFTETEQKGFNFQYIREGKRIRWGKHWEDIGMSGGRFFEMFPKKT